MKFGEKLKEQRTSRKIRQEDLALQVDVSLRTIQHYETGHSYPHSRSIYRRLAEIFNVDVNYFLTEDEEFITKAAELYGKTGVAQAESLVKQSSALFAGGELSDDDKLAFVHEIQELYFDSKSRNPKLPAKKSMRGRKTSNS
ncbi:hypothetical protein FACS1894105_10030 [Clostridia bacterium]|nr:hypothetical protein FACS1894105_10030 [Clostridia bacterium]